LLDVVRAMARSELDAKIGEAARVKGILQEIARRILLLHERDVRVNFGEGGRVGGEFQIVRKDARTNPSCGDSARPPASDRPRVRSMTVIVSR
jgi:hypothetical protein